MALLLSIFSAANVGAHTAQIETPTLTASRAEWFGLQADTSGIGIVQRNASQQGEFIFNDAGKDQRLITTTDPVTKETDLDWFGVTADEDAIYFLAKVDNYCCITNNPSLELLVTVDTTQNGAGTTDLPLVQAAGTYSTTKVANDAAWEFAVRTTFPSGASGSRSVNGTTRIHTNATGAGSSCNAAGCSSQVASASVDKGSFAEVKVPWGQIGGKPTGSKFLRLTVSTLYDDHTVPADGYNSPVIDVLGTNSGAGATLADLQDGTIDTSFDVHFNTNGAAPTYEPYAPLMVTEYQPNPIGSDSPGPTNPSTETEWIEVYNPNGFPITLSDYKLGNTPKRGSGSQGMFKFKASSIPANGVVVVAKEKARFLAGHPGFAGTVYDLGSDMTQYTAWASGQLQLDNQPDISGVFEEQVVLLDAKDGIVDMSTYGNPTTAYPGHTPFFVSAVPEGVSYERCPVGRDTNNSTVDFIAHSTPGEQSPGAVCLGVPGLDLTVAKTGTANPIENETGTIRYANFTITASNIGTQPENSTIVVSDTLPAGLTFDSAVPAPTNVVGSALGWTFNGMAPGASSTIVLTATVDSSVGENVPLTNNVLISGPSELPEAKNNNAASWTVTTLGPPDLNISSNFSGPISPGTTFGFVITYQNTGQNDVSDVTITDVLPAGVTILSEQSDTATWNNATSGTVTWTVSSLQPNETGTIVITARLSSAAPNNSALTNTLSITVPATDPTPANNAESKTTTVGMRKLYMPITVKL
jgi:uncharacterized repeat protein (TIGR01451 family)